MKGYKNFLITFCCLFILYVVAEVNKPNAVQWNVTLEKSDKNPYGAYILFDRLKDVFPNASIQSYRLPVYNQVNNYAGNNSAYAIISPEFAPSKVDFEEMDAYVKKGNYVFIASGKLSKLLQEKLKLRHAMRVTVGLNDSTSVKLVHPVFNNRPNYVFRKTTIDEYFSRIDTARSTVLGINDAGRPNFIRISNGRGAYLVHAAPLCFSNYFMLFRNNSEYAAAALSYLPAEIETLFWDEYYKLGPTGAKTPLRFFLTNPFLSAALWLSVAGLMIYVLFGMKRRQRIIPVITPLRNNTLDFITTISTVYLQQKDNQGIAHKKISHFLEFIRHRFFIPTNQFDDQFLTALSRKSGIEHEELLQLVAVVREVHYGYPVNDTLLVTLNRQIDNFYKKVK